MEGAGAPAAPGAAAAPPPAPTRQPASTAAAVEQSIAELGRLDANMAPSADEDLEAELDEDDMQEVEFDPDLPAPGEDSSDDEAGEMAHEETAGEEDETPEQAAKRAAQQARLQSEAHAVSRSFAGHADHVFCIDLSADGSRALSGGGDDTAYVWDTRSGAQLHKLSGHTDSISQCGFSSDGRLCATAGYDNVVKVWDAQSGALVRTLEGPSAEVEFVEWHSRGNVVLAGSADCTAWVWDAASGNVVSVLAGHEAALTCGGFTPNGKRAVTGALDGQVRLWDPATSSCVHAFQGHDWHQAGVVSLAFSTLATIFACGGQDGSVRVGSLEARRAVASFDHDTGRPRSDLAAQAEAGAEASSVEAVAFCDVANFLASGATDGKVRIFDLNTQSCRQVCQHDDTVIKLAFLPQSMLFVSGSADGAVRLWDSRSGYMVRLLTAHKDLVNDFSLKGGVLASCGDDRLCHVSTALAL
jgi:WD40 repeat protein